MKKLIIIPVFAFAINYNTIISNIPNSYVYKLSKNKVTLSQKALNATKALNYGKLDVSYNAVRFFTRPVMKITSPMPVTALPDGSLVYQNVNSELPMSDKSHFIGEIKYSYPLFTGYAITSSIEKSKLNVLKEKLNFQNTKRVLILNATKLYSAIYALKQEQNALQKAKVALLSAKDKAKALFKAGLINKAQIDEIDAKYYNVLAQIKSVNSKKEELKNTLSSLLNMKIDSIDTLPEVSIFNNLDAKNRPDVKAIKLELKIQDKNLKLAKSSFYPKLLAQVALKKEADNLGLSKNDYQNIDKSYIAIGVEYNIFNGGEDKEKLEMAKIAKIQATLFYKDYLQKAKTELKNDLSTLNALKYQLKAAQSEVKARKSYYDYIRAKFNEGLVDSSDLNDAIAKLAISRAKKDKIKADIFFYTIKANLDGKGSL